jgi:hypothetical protein
MTNQMYRDGSKRSEHYMYADESHLDKGEGEATMEKRKEETATENATIRGDRA